MDSHLEPSQSRASHYCLACQAELDANARLCPYCQQKQLSPSELKLFAFGRLLIPKQQAAYKILLAAIVIHFVLLSADILLHPSYGFNEALLAPPSELLYRWGAHIRGDLLWWRLLTANFVHIGIIHLLFNGYALRYVTPYVERSFGTALTLALFVILGSLSMLCSNLLGGAVLVAGASGGLMAFIGIAAAVAHRENTTISKQVRNAMLNWAALTLVFGLVVSYFSAMGIDNVAHGAGFVFGLIFGYILPRQTTTGFTRAWIYRLAATLLALALGSTSLALYQLAQDSLRQKAHNACVQMIKQRDLSRAEQHCHKAYLLDPTRSENHHNYILLKIMQGKREDALDLCREGKTRFAQEKPSFASICEHL